ncbi:hypothetical protein [Natrarchaeobius chitinivorans]|uniref:CARDB domain-containing protein n=1 Tax=Natrarchaeobius chitinivorans TaxID=1679083 RepID=A0A3N6LZM7_NATCH|nr:hypothetical protein [Natrarchaeobius chitinivorans]RQG94677.1 hypothetical protein EA473_11405 [Natrarchaeobius chitinivorans]
MSNRFVVLAFVVLLVGSLPAGVAGATTGIAGSTSGSVGSGDPGDAPAGGDLEAAPGETAAVSNAAHPAVASRADNDGANDVLHRTTTLRHLPDRPGTFETEKRFRVPDPVVDLEIHVGQRSEIESTDGFEKTGDGWLRWTGETDEPVVRFTRPANRTGDVGHHSHSTAEIGPQADGSVRFEPQADGSIGLASDGVEPAVASDAEAFTGATNDGYTFVDTGEWGIVQVPGIDISLRQTESVGHDETVQIDGPGATGGHIAFFGEVTEHQRTVGGETIRLVVPDAADLEERPADVLDTLAYASERLDVGARSDEVFVVAAPADVDLGPQGVQYGDADAWVVADAPLEDPTNVWVHEYVHVRQGFTGGGGEADAGSGTEWLTEAQAEYYAALLSFELGLIEFEEFSRHLGAGERSPYADGVLVDPTTWQDGRTDYVKGRLVYGEIDRTLRQATDGDRTLVDVFRLLNARDGVTEPEFLELLEAAGGPEVRSVAERYTRTDETPAMWSQADHGSAFGLQGATIEYGLDAESIEVADEPWVRDRASEESITVPVDQRVSVPVTAENVGDRDGTADPTLEVDGRIVDHSQTTLSPGERTTDRLVWTPTEPGAYELAVGSERIPVHVRPHSSVVVADLSVEPETVEPGEPATVRATLESRDDRAGAALLEVRTVDGVVDEHLVRVEPGETETIETELSFDDDGGYEVAIGDASTTVSVSTDSAIGIEDEPLPGFGVGGALAALLAVLIATAVTPPFSRSRRE